MKKNAIETQVEDRKRELNKKIMDCFREDEQKKKSLPKDLRTAFWIKHHAWIDFLNDREKYFALSLTKQESESEKILFDSWQYRHGLTVSEYDKIDHSTVTMVKWASLSEFIKAFAIWMYENLRNISRENWKEIRDVGAFTIKEVNILLSMLQFKIGNDGKVFVDWETPRSDVVEIFKIQVLARYAYKFSVEYIQEVINGGLKSKAKLGVFKVGVCPYQKRKNPECGRVFVATKYNGEACKEHARKWVAILRNRKKITVFKKK
jgi:hypothetical protein